MLHPLSSAGGRLVLLIALIFLMVGGDTGRSASPRSARCMGPKGNGMFGCFAVVMLFTLVKHEVFGPSRVSGDSFLPSLCTF